MPNAHDTHADCKSTLSRSVKGTPRLKRPNSDTKHEASAEEHVRLVSHFSHGNYLPELREKTVGSQFSSEKLSCLIALPHVTNRTPRLTVILSKHIFSKSIIRMGDKYTKDHDWKKLTFGNHFSYILKISHSKRIQFNVSEHWKCRFGAPFKKIPPKWHIPFFQDWHICSIDKWTVYLSLSLDF